MVLVVVEVNVALLADTGVNVVVVLEGGGEEGLFVDADDVANDVANDVADGGVGAGAGAICLSIEAVLFETI